MGGGEFLSVIVADGLTHRFGSEVALEGLDLVLDSGEHMAVLGENGAGKTTLLRVLATALRPTAGRLRIAGLDAFQERRRLRHYLGYVAHAPGLYPALSAAENLEFFCDLQGVSRSRAAEVLETVGLKMVAHRRADQLSRGTQQRLAIGRAILHEPRLLILDDCPRNPVAGPGLCGAGRIRPHICRRTRAGVAGGDAHDAGVASRDLRRQGARGRGAARRLRDGSPARTEPVLRHALVWRRRGGGAAGNRWHGRARVPVCSRRCARSSA